MPKMFVGVVCDSTEEAAEVAAAFAQICNLPYSLTQWGANMILSRKKRAEQIVADALGDPPQQQEKEQSAPGAFINPPGTPVAFVTEKRKESIRHFCAVCEGRSAEEIRKHIAAPLEHTINVLAKLHEQEVVAFDGERYYAVAQ